MSLQNEDAKNDNDGDMRKEKSTARTAAPTSENGDTELNALKWRCGYGKCRPDCLQAGNNAKGLLACICLFVFVQGFLVNGINNVNVSSLERRFDLPSTRVAWISSTNDFSAGIICLVFGYIGMFMHKGRIMAVTAGFMSVGSFVMFLPHLLVGDYELGVKVSDECDIFDNLTRCAGSTSHRNSDYLYVFMAGMALVGVGGSAVFLLGTTWLDDNLQTENTPLFLGIMHAFAALGPVAAFLGGGAILDNIYVDVNKPVIDGVDIDANDPRWVGAWWIGFLVSSLASVFLVFLVACFPPILPGSLDYRNARQSQAYRGQGDKETSDVNFGRSWKDIGTSLKIIFTNPPWILCTLAGILESGAVMAFNTFLPKMLQFQFGMTSGMAAIFSGAVVVPGAAIGQVIGGLIPKWANLKVRGLFLQCGISSVVAMVFSPIMLLRCDMPAIAGVTRDYSMNSTLNQEAWTLVNSCNEQCNCTTRSYEPICDSQGMEYFSPCHAGCLESETENGEQYYQDCSCIDGDIMGDVTPTSQWQATEGICSATCNKLPIFMTLFFVIVLATFISDTAGHTVVIRCVPDKNRSFAYGVLSSIVRLLGNVPGPIIFGFIFDQSCLVWKDECGTRGSCWIYDNAALSWRLFMIVLIVNVISGVLFFLAAIIYRSPPAGDISETVLDIKGFEEDPKDVVQINTNGAALQENVPESIMTSTKL